jgi:DNA invertase Pin-like site-specific DNA recombinase
MFGMLGVFAEFEREMIVVRVNAGLDRAKREGTVLVRPRLSSKVESQVRAELAKGSGILKTARLIGVGSGTVPRIKREQPAA